MQFNTAVRNKAYTLKQTGTRKQTRKIACTKYMYVPILQLHCICSVFGTCKYAIYTDVG